MTEIIPLSQLTEVPEVDSRVAGGVATIGNFDGVHLGHAALLRQVCRLSREQGGPAVAVVLDPHPAAILRPDRAPPKLTWIERRAELMERVGIDALVVCETTPAFLRLTAEAFFRSLVLRRLGAVAMVEGPNFFFGRDRGGDISILKELCGDSGVALHIVEPTRVSGEMISSTRIRGLLEAGDVDQAVKLLGSPFRIRGEVGTGAKRGRQIGFPTANLMQMDVVVPAPGVYAGLATIAGTTHRAAIHIGPNPTFDDDSSVKVEIHLLDYEGDLYGQWMLVDFVTRVRDIARFESPGHLIQQLRRDVQTIRNHLDSYCDSQA